MADEKIVDMSGMRITNPTEDANKAILKQILINTEQDINAKIPGKIITHNPGGQSYVLQVNSATPLGTAIDKQLADIFTATATKIIKSVSEVVDMEYPEKAGVPEDSE